MLAASGGKLASERHGRTRREVLSLLVKGVLTYPLAASELGAFARRTPAPSQAVPADRQLTADELLEEIVSRSFLFFWNEAGKRTGLVRDRALADGGPDKRSIASIAATGFGLSALCIGHQRGYLPEHQIRGPRGQYPQLLLNHVEHVNGIFYHFIDMNTGKRVRMSEVSPIDTTILLCGVLTARAYFRDPVISHLATNIYARVNWRWMLNGGKTFAMGWTPEYKFIGARWDTYCELMMMYLLAIAAPVYNISSSAWDAFARPMQQFEGYNYISGNRSAVRAPVLARVVRFSQPAGRVRQLLSKLSDCDLRPSAVLPFTALALSRLRPEHLGHHRFRLPARLPDLGWPTRDRIS